ncbi:PREDICTED: protein NDR1-like [Nelumbo nucifera]|uniref:Late embryogenesis abundant protein LEA-2 subgroup domain-containing protein n=2 Tax=Nelumbo nucifera TaxID=4432 RepID=A0A822XW93_NELNU|nr:PREDICTED: protein NDR1-like [Nelumbo nucifera]DAD23266.1 TPA_asm: hypothetical protein HUJ06_024729 [Nelumbo nucifera]
MPESPRCCRCCISFIFSAGLTTVFLWLNLHIDHPNYFIQNFQVPPLNLTAHDTRNATIAFNLKLANGNKDKGIYYDEVNIALYYGGINRTIALGNTSIPPFYQGHKKKAIKAQTMEARRFPLQTALKEVSNNRTVVFQVDLATAVRFKTIWWKTKRHRMSVGGDVHVNREGMTADNKDIELKSSGAEFGCYHTPAAMLALVVLLLILC